MEEKRLVGQYRIIVMIIHQLVTGFVKLMRKRLHIAHMHITVVITNQMQERKKIMMKQGMKRDHITPDMSIRQHVIRTRLNVHMNMIARIGLSQGVWDMLKPM